jgi:hypothetical protein
MNIDRNSKIANSGEIFSSATTEGKSVCNWIEEGRLYFGNIDILDGTPLLDIKPYVPEMDHPGDVKIG